MNENSALTPSRCKDARDFLIAQLLLEQYYTSYYLSLACGGKQKKNGGEKRALGSFVGATSRPRNVT
jgi:hypothetical protein